MCLQKFAPQFSDFLKSATGQLPTYACRNVPHLQIFQNVPLESYLSLLHALSEIPPLSLQIIWNLPLASYLGYLPEIYTTGQITYMLPICAYRNSPPEFADFLKSATGQLPKLPDMC